MARSYLARERRDHTLQATALAHEACIRLAQQPDLAGCGPAELMPIAARVMREVLIDYARRKKSQKRGAGWNREPLDAACALYEQRAVDLLALNDALARLAAFDSEAAAVVELRFFGGLSEEAAAAVMGTSARTVRRAWRSARLWLARELAEE